ncbi:phytochelatin synthase family protein [Aromatoleum diolicum]|uniref:glutathione gamma-glutamylcysteinyltransferase n=1 Tax=Aromatoleum diolicum TaxID=75796 RepID=A0ABX1QAV6_9RHOO|nr:phytochelatin synthase family protein [Aromatoleum diolicum]NMG74507.1 glutathione gamma-glutamylcysteinyltransferase [Aromatoleum diolicum]
MKIISFKAMLLAACLSLPCGAAIGRTLPLPAGLVSLGSEQGAHLLLDSEARQAYWPLSLQFVTQKTQTYCGVATIVMVLNALEVPAPTAPGIEPFTAFDQDNFFNERTDAILLRPVLAKIGMTLDQIGGLLGAYSVKADVRHAGDGGLDEFRTLAVRYLGTPGRYVIVNYLRRTIGQESGGHISPLAAYDADTDRFLILDVSRYKYPPVWVKAADLYAAMNTPDSDNENRTRGYVLVTAGD